MCALRWIVVVAVVLCGISSATAAVRTESGWVEGSHVAGQTIYRGIPYAEAPIGSLRWREPAAPKPWTGIRNATRFAPACMQSGVSMPGEAPPETSEDCLYLNVWTPGGKGKARLPVMVWIYGGGYANGSAAMPLYWGDALAAKGAVVVSFGYRVGPLGFLAHPELSKEAARHASGNYGLLDQLAALAWVKRNIATFGGDPECVTIFGQSAGSMAVSILMASPRAKGLFQRAIGQSGGLFEPLQLAPSYQLANAERDGEAYAASLGAHSLAELRALPAAALLNGNASQVTHPVLDGFVLPESPYEAFANGRQNDVPLLLGSNAEEARSLVVDLSAVTAARYEDEIQKHWGALPKPLFDGYPHATDSDARQARLDFERDLRFGWDMWAWARLQAQSGRQKIFAYNFAQQPPFPKSSSYAGWGASHFAELWYMFDHLGQEQWAWSAADRKLASTMSSYWVNFARSGNPNANALPPWPEFRASEQALTLDKTMWPGPVANRAALERFDAVYDAVRGKPFGTRSP